MNRGNKIIGLDKYLLWVLNCAEETHPHFGGRELVEYAKELHNYALRKGYISRRNNKISDIILRLERTYDSTEEAE